MLTDAWGRAITYLRLSVTDKCNYRYTYCMPPAGIPLLPRNRILTLEQMAEVALAAGGLGFTKIKFTGGEPLVRKNVEFLIASVARSGRFTDIGLTTNGALLTLDKALALREAGLQRINVSLDTLEPARFAAITRGGRLQDVFNGITAAQTAGLDPVKINMIVFDDTKPEELDAMKRFCKSCGCLLQTIRHFSLHDRENSSGSQGCEDRPPRCATCNRLRLTSDGFLKSCLFSNKEIHADFNDLEASICRAIKGKPAQGRACTTRSMSQIGG
ncbi:MAG: radical SAM protein [Chitinivibrionales bacterium]|nr:radical SAM protein [Chitinivibrionales bacterium]